MKSARLKYGETTIPLWQSWEDATISTWAVPSSQPGATEDFSLTLVQRRIPEPAVDLEQIICPSNQADGMERTRRPNIKITSLDTDAPTAEWKTKSPIGNIWQIQSAFSNESWIYILTGSTSDSEATEDWGEVFEAIVSSIKVAAQDESQRN